MDKENGIMHTSTIFSNMNRKTAYWREDNDCSVKAIAIALDICYAKSWYLTRKFGRPYKKGMNMDQILDAVKSMNKDIVTITFDGSDQKFMDYYPRGTYLVATPSHIMTYKDGILHDSPHNWLGPVQTVYHVLDPMEEKEFEKVVEEVEK